MAFCYYIKIGGVLKARLGTNHDAHAHLRAKNNGNCHDACSHRQQALPSTVTISILWTTRFLGVEVCILQNSFLEDVAHQIQNSSKVLHTHVSYIRT